MATIDIELRDEGVECWRPVEAEHLGEDRYRIIEEQPDSERWAFPSRTVVRCSPRLLAGPETTLGTVTLVALEKEE
jgi:hypothetical protein